MSQNFDAIVLGAGIVGAGCALECAQTGLRTAIVERESPGPGGGTAAGMGHIVLMDDSPAQFALTRLGQQLWREFAQELPAHTEFRRPGTLWIAADAEEMEEVHRKRDFYSAQDVPVEILDSQSLAEAEPNLRRPLAGALLVPSDSIVRPPLAARFLLEKAGRQPVQLTVFSGQIALAAGQGRVQLADGTELHAPILINATGAVSPALTAGIPVRKRKGHLVITQPYPHYVHHQLVELGYLTSAHATESDSVAFNIQPRANGQLVVGSSRQFDSETDEVEPHMVETMLARAAEYMPGLPSLTIQHAWAGHRAATPDKLPLIGPTADPTVFLATGHEGLGLTTSLATARILLDQILNRPSAIPIEPYLPSRISH